MDFEGIQRRCQTCHCHCKSDSARSIAANIQAQEEIIHDSVKGNMTTKNHGVVESNYNNFICLHCKMLLERVNSFLKNVKDLDKNKWSSICDHCRDIKSTNQCRRCSYLVSQFKKGKEKCQDTQKWEDMLNKVKLFIETLTINKCYVNSCEIAQESEDLAEMFELMQIPSISCVVVKESSDLDVGKYQNKWKYLNNLKIEYPKTSEINSARKRSDLIPVQSEQKEICICQKFAKISENISLATVTEEKPLTININSKENIMYKKTDDVNVTSKPPPPKGLKTSKKIINGPRDVGKIEKKSDKVKANESSELFIKMILKERKNRDRSKGDQRLNISKDRKRFEEYLRTEIDELPPLPVKIIEQRADEESGSVLDCKQLKFFEPLELIQENKILTQEPNNKQLKHHHSVYREPLFFEVQHDFSHTTGNISSDNIKNEIGHRRISELSSTKSRAKYELSNRRYIEDGNTILPRFKIMRRMKLYKMITLLSKFDWLEKYKDQKHMYYTSGEKLSEITDDGQIRWYYKDGCLALHFSNTKENYSTDEFLIYDSVHLRKKSGQQQNNLLLACFDKMGHGIVYDRKGTVRLKYNQCEGIILDENVGPTARWKWNNLNEPPELQHTFEESYDPIGDCLKSQTKGTIQNEVTSNIFDKEMYTIELEGYVKETFNKMNTQYKQYQIKFKVLKMNEHFTLKILEQSKIFLLFRDGEITFKLNLGMRLISNEIIGVKTVDFCDVVTPYDDKV